WVGFEQTPDPLACLPGPAEITTERHLAADRRVMLRPVVQRPVHPFHRFFIPAREHQPEAEHPFEIMTERIERAQPHRALRCGNGTVRSVCEAIHNTVLAPRLRGIWVERGGTLKRAHRRGQLAAQDSK